MSKVKRGTVELDLDGEVYELRPTLSAYEKIEARFGGLRGALEAMTRISVTDLAHVIAAGSGKGQRDMQKIKEGVFNQGVDSVTEQVGPFVLALFNPRGDDSEGNQTAASE